ncbi:MAG: hypothetical protein K6T30_05385 [Alicyclobacillus sp.]|nr:hypothetical protein [Alicyclobacillus sp.]
MNQGIVGWVLHQAIASGLWMPAAVLLLALTFACARRLGIRQGRREGMRLAPVSLRARCLESGVCPICGSGPVRDPSSHTSAASCRPSADCTGGKELCSLAPAPQNRV